MGLTEVMKHSVGRVLPTPVKKRIRQRLGGPYSEAPGPLERNPSWNNPDLDFYLVDWVKNERAENERSQELVIEYVAGTLAGSPERLSLLDVACGNGRFYRGLQRAGLLDRLDYRGTDITPKLIEACRTLQPGVPFDEASMEELPYPDGSYDVVVCQHAISYLEYYDQAIAELLRVSRRLVLLVVKGVGEGEDRLGTYWNERHQEYFRANLYEQDKLKAFAREQGASLAFTLNDARHDDPDGQYCYVFCKPQATTT